VPLVDRQGVAGIMQQRLLDMLVLMGMDCQQRRISWQEALKARSMVVTNAVIGCWPITSLQLLSGSQLNFAPPNWLAAAQQQINAEDGLNRQCDF